MSERRSLIMFNEKDDGVFAHGYYPVDTESPRMRSLKKDLIFQSSETLRGYHMPLDRPIEGNPLKVFGKKTVRKLGRGTFEETARELRNGNEEMGRMSSMAAAYFENGSGEFDEMIEKIREQLAEIEERMERAQRTIMTDDTADESFDVDLTELEKEAEEEADYFGMEESWGEDFQDDILEKELPVFDEDDFKDAISILNKKYAIPFYRDAGKGTGGFYRRAVRKMNDFYIKPVVDDQTYYNATNTRAMNDIAEYIEMDKSLDRDRIEKLLFQVEMLNKRACKLEEKLKERKA